MQHRDGKMLTDPSWELLDGSIYSQPTPMNNSLLNWLLLFFLVLQDDGLKLQLEGTFVALKSHIMFYSVSGREGNKGKCQCICLWNTTQSCELLSCSPSDTPATQEESRSGG